MGVCVGVCGCVFVKHCAPCRFSGTWIHSHGAARNLMAVFGPLSMYEDPFAVQSTSRHHCGFAKAALATAAMQEKGLR